MLKGVKPLRRRHFKSRTIDTSRTVQFIRSYYQLFALAFLIIAGLIFGSLLAKSTYQNQNNFSFFMQSSISDDIVSKSFISLLLSSFFSSSALLCVAFLLGLCAAGLPGLIFLPLFKGAGLGLSIGCLYLQYGVKGVAICAVCFLPDAVMSSIAVIISCREGIRLSLKIAGVIMPGSRQVQLWDVFNSYCFKFVLCFVLVLISAVIQASVTAVFSKFLF